MASLAGSKFSFDIWYLVFQQLAFEQEIQERENQQHLAPDISETNIGVTRYQAEDFIEKVHTITDFTHTNPQEETYPVNFLTWLRGVRLLSKSLNAAVAPILYNFVDLSERLSFDKLAPELSDQIRNNVKAFTVRLMVPTQRTLSADNTAFIQECRKLRRLSWFVDNKNYRYAQHKDMSIKAIARVSATYLDYLMRINTRGTVAFDTLGENWCTAYTIKHEKTRLPSPYRPPFRPSVLQQPGIPHQRVVICLNRNFNHFVPFGGCLRPMESLLLESYTWVHPARDVPLIWDFTQLKYLELEMTGQDIIAFIRTVPRQQLAQLREIKMWPWMNQADFSTLRELLRHLFADLPKLEAFTIDLNDQYERLCPPNIFSLFRGSLKRLRLRESDRDANGENSVTYSVQDLRDLYALTSTTLEELTIVLPMFPYDNVEALPPRDHFEAQEFLDFIPKFPVLRTLHLYAAFGLREMFQNNDRVDSADVDYDDAEKIMKQLRESKVGVPFERINITLKESTIPKGIVDPSTSWIAEKRVFASRVTSDGVYEQWVAVGCSRGEVGKELWEEDDSDIDVFD